MCNLYSMTRNAQAIGNLFWIPHNRLMQFDPLPAIFPGQAAPVVRRAEDCARELVSMSWGFVLLQPGKAPRRVTNTRDDKASSRFWKPSLGQRRCLVPATSFCEPNDGRAPGERATWLWFALTGDESQPLFAFAGLWQRWRGPEKKDGPNVELEVYSFMTTEPNSATASINHERSPVLLTSDEERDAWLEGSTAEALAVVWPVDGVRLRIVGAGLEKTDAPD